jgi:leucyl aminopeptidase
MALMKKDMGGAANVLGLAQMIMEAKLPVHLRVLIPAVENAISGEAFRPGDILKSRKGLTIEIGNTDAEGRLVLGDALALADEEEPDLLVDMATLTGAARVALGPDLPPFYTSDEALASELARQAIAQNDPLWRLPLWERYNSLFESSVADMNNSGDSGFAGSITAALFLKRFVERTKSYIHLDVYGHRHPDGCLWLDTNSQARKPQRRRSARNKGAIRADWRALSETGLKRIRNDLRNRYAHSTWNRTGPQTLA